MTGSSIPLREGAEVLLDGQPRRVMHPGITASAEGAWIIHLARPDGAVEGVPLRDLLLRRTVTVVRPDARRATPTPPVLERKPGLDSVDQQRRDLLSLRLAHVLEAETGYRSGDPTTRLPGEPRP